MIIDCHVHVHTCPGAADIDRKIEELLYFFPRLDISGSSLMISLSASNCIYHTRADIAAQAEMLGHIIEKYPGKFFGMLYMNGALAPDDLIALTEKHVLHGPITGIKLSIQMNARDPRFKQYFTYLETNNIPVLFHAWYKTTDKYLLESDPSDICYLADQHPGLRILMPHLTGCRRRGIQDIKRHSNVWIDTSGSQPEEGFLSYALSELGPDRILYGSDYPGRDMAAQLGRIASVDLGPEEREKILYKNALNFFGK